MPRDRVWVIYNGPSSREWHNYRFRGAVFGCNFAYRDFPITDLYVADRRTVHEVRKDDPRGIYCYTKRSPLELPPGWRHLDMPGIDSGSFALEQAFIRYPQSEIIVIGADGVLGGDNSTVYEYSWRSQQPTQKAHERHRKTVLELLDLYRPNCRFVSESQDPEILTIRKDEL